MEAQTSGRSGASLTALVPGVQGFGAAAQDLSCCAGIEQVGVVAVVAVQVLTHQLQPQVSGEPASTLPRTCGIAWVARVLLTVEDCDIELGVVGPGSAVEVRTAHGRPDIIDHHQFGVDVDRHPGSGFDIQQGEATIRIMLTTQPMEHFGATRRTRKRLKQYLESHGVFVSVPTMDINDFDQNDAEE